MLRIILYPLFIFSLFTGNISPQTKSYNISGFIKEEKTGEALIGTNVLLYKDRIETGQPPFSGTATNNFGFYVMPRIPAGKFILICRHIGYKPVLREIEIVDQNYFLNINMTPEDIKLEDVLVTGEREEKGAISTIDVSPDLLSRLPSLTGEMDLFKLLEKLPGIKSANELSSGLYVRGGSPDQTLTLVDGAILYNPSHLGNISSTFNSNAIRDIKLVKGGFPAEYGGRLSSVLDIKLRSGTKEKETGTLGLGLINSFFAVEGPINEKTTYMISGRGMYYDAVQKTIDNESSTPRYNFYDINGKVSYGFNNNNIISISYLFNKDNVYSPALQDIDYDIQWENTILNFNWLNITSRSILLSSSLSLVNYHFRSVIGENPYSASPVRYFASSKLSDLNFRQDVEVRWHEDHTFKNGLELLIHNYDLLYSDYYNPLIEIDPYTGSKLSSVEAALYLQNESQITPLLKTNVGGRFYYFGEKKYFRFEPRISASYAISENLFVKGGFAIAHQFLHLITKNEISLPTDLWYPSTTNISPGKSSQFIFGIDYYFNNQEYLVSAETYYKDMKSLYEFSSSASLNPLDDLVEEQFVKGEGEAYGFEFFFNKRAGNLNGWVGYTLSWTKRKFDQLNSGKIFYPKYDRRHDVSLVLAYNFSDELSTGLTWVFSTGQRFTLPPGQYVFDKIGLPGSTLNLNHEKLNASVFPDYHKLDLNITYKFTWLSKAFEAYINLYNVYNRQNPFAQYLVLQDDDSSETATAGAKLKQLTLFPFIPTAGFSFRF